MEVAVLLIAAAQVGVIGAISGLAAPTVFQALESTSAGAYLRRLFPRYFVTAAAVALVATLVAAAGGLWGTALLLVADAACFAAARALIPWINAAKDRGDPRFAQLHRASTLLNGVGLVLALAAVGVLVAG